MKKTGAIVVIFVIVVTALSWLVTCGVVKVLSMCFSFAYSWKLATGIWLVCLMLRWIISAAKQEK